MPRNYGKTPLPLGPWETPSRFKSTPTASLAALSWAAERAGLSYGLFTINLSPDDQVRIQSEYEAYQREEQAAKARRRAERETSQVPSVRTTFSERPVLYADPEIIYYGGDAADADYTRVAKDVEEISVPIPASLDSIGRRFFCLKSP